MSLNNTISSISFVLLTLVMQPLVAQDAKVSDFGVKGGFNFATIGGESNPFTVKFNGGIYGNTYFSYFWSMRAELLVSGQGHGSESGAKLNLTYLNLPILAGYSPNYNLSFHAGPQVGILLGGNIKIQDNKTKVSSEFNTFDIGLVLDGTYYLLEKRLGISLRYIHGLSNISKNNNVSGNRFNRVIQLTAAYRLNFNTN